MTRYICLLRSVNVSGVNRIKMKALKVFFETEGFGNVTTYIQSGNIIFDAPEKPSAILLEEKIKTQFQTKNVAVWIKTPEEMTAIIAQNPYTGIPYIDAKKCYVYYLESAPDSGRLEALEKYSFEDECFTVCKDVIYAYYKIGLGKSKMSNTFFEKKLNKRSTARNWKTTTTLLALAQGNSATP